MNKKERIKELESVAMELFDMIHESDSIVLKLRANALHDTIVNKPSK